MPFLLGWQRKLALVPLGFFMVGWLVYSVGFIWTLIGESNPSNHILFPYYVTLVGGPVVYLSGSLHAILTGVASAAVGIFVAFVSTSYFASVGWIMYERGLNTTVSYTQVPSDDFNSQTSLMFIGVLFAVICWCLLLILAMFYKNQEDENINHGHDCLPRTNRGKRMQPFTGTARTLSIPLLILSAVGWCIFIFGYYRSSLQVEVFDESTKPMVIATFIIAPLLYLTSLLHTGCSGKASTVGVLTAVLHVLYVVSVGFVITHVSLYVISCESKQESGNCMEHYLSYMLIGGVVSLFFWTSVHALKQFYKEFNDTDGVRQRGLNDLNVPPERPPDPQPPNNDAPVAAAAQQMQAGEAQPLLADHAQ